MGKVKRTPTVTERRDEYANLVNGLGDPNRDATTRATFKKSPLKVVEYYMDLYSEDPLAGRIANLPAEEALRQGFRLDLGEGEQPSFLADFKKEYKRLEATARFVEAMAWARACGGAAIYMGVNDGQKQDKPLDPARVKRVVFLKTLTRSNLIPQTWYEDTAADKFGEPETYLVRDQAAGGGNSRSLVVHESRILRFDGVVTTDERRARNQGWGDSIFLGMEPTLKRFWQAAQGMSVALADADQAVFKINNLLAIVKGSKEGDEAVRKRMSLLQYGRSVARAIAVDTHNEDFQFVSRTFTGYDSSLYALMYLVSSCSGIPVTLLFGRSPAGLNATGDADVRFFYDKVKAYQENALEPRLRRFVEVLLAAKEGPAKGKVPETWEICFEPLWQMTPVERADLRLKTAQADALDIQNEVLTPEEVTRSHYSGAEYNPSITIDVDDREGLFLETDDPETDPDATPPEDDPSNGEDGPPPRGTRDPQGVEDSRSKARRRDERVLRRRK